MNKEFLPNISEDNRFKYHEVMGGKKGDWNEKYCFDNNAPEARELLISLRRDSGINLKDISEEIKVSPSTISKVARGMAGLIPKKEYKGLSTTEYVVKSLEQMIKIEQTD
ncbi:MAG: winged helix-turn-helix transcriptional regulator [Candidatus Shapirobacteria bacterium]